MNLPWVICLAKTDAAWLAPLRLLPKLEVAESGPSLWLRGQPGDDTLTARLSALPARARYELLPLNQLRLIGQRVPSARLPELLWQPLNRWIEASVPPSALPGDVPPRVPLRLVRSSREQVPELLSTSLELFQNYTRQAPRVRLDRLQFAADGQGRVMVRGTPLPPVPGQRYVLHGGVAVPAGFSWEPAVSVEALARVFGISGDAIVLWGEDGKYSRVHAEQFIPVTRSAVRATIRALATTP